MQQTYRFGLNAELVQNAAILEDFEEIRNNTNDVDNGVQNHNPYGASYFNDPNQMALVPDGSKVTSIPSPYARMHITDIAFREMMAGTGVMDVAAHERHINNMSGDYLRAISHCLDVYEMMYRFNDLDLIDKGITIKRVELVSHRDSKYNDLLNDPNKKLLACFVDTLDLFRQRYLKDIRDKNVPGYKFDFSQIYVFKYKGRTFASTSPFTGFFAKADCDLSDADLETNWTNSNGQRITHRLFTVTSKEWLGLKDRDPEFVRFLYLLFRDVLGGVFSNMYTAVRACIPDEHILSDVSFATEYPKFNFGDEVLPQIAGNTQNVSYIRPDGLDCSYLKYLLYLRTPVELSISEGAYDKKIEDRVFPEGTTEKVPWIGVNDFLSDVLFVLPYDIDKNYYAVEYIDENSNSHRRCLLPLKRQALDYLDIETVEQNLYVKKYSSNHYAVVLTLPLTTGGKVELRRDYFDVEDDNCTFPNGALKDMQNANHHFAFGIYPFVRSAKFENIYKVLFYNDFEWPVGYHPQKNDKLYDLKFFYFDGNHKATDYKDVNVIANKTNSADKDFKVNTHYYNVSDSKTKVNDEHISIDFVELTLDVVKNPTSGNPEHIKGTAIIAPKYHPVAHNDGETTIAVDLGTSNTFIAYEHEGDSVREISTIHDGWYELTLLNCRCEHNDRDDAIEENRSDLYLRTNDNESPDDYCLPAQLCEFIPTRIRQSNEEKETGYHFPIPSVLNNLRVDGKNDKAFTNRVALVHSAIPFAYYTIGKRPNTEANRYDSMSNGEFKWFYRKMDDGIYGFDSRRQDDFNAFLNELLFIVRSHMLCCGFDLEKCRLLWTYPLSFEDELVEYYQETWQRAYCKYFNPTLLSPQGQVTSYGREQMKDLVLYTNESRSPIYECMKNPSAANHLTILMDIGGGSTDVIGYKRNEPKFITSFGFAGNALYLSGSLNHTEEELQQNYMRYFVKRSCMNVLTSATSLNNTKKIGLDAQINTLMNYGFSEAPMQFRSIFNNEPTQFMLQFHNAALFYHTAQLCRIESPDELPDIVYLTGNGSKLFQMCKNPDMIKKIFTEVYGEESHIKSEKPRDPKAATALGALKGFRDRNKQQGLRFNEDSRNQKVVMLGDAQTINPDMNDTANYSSDIRENIENFVDLFFKIYNSDQPFFTKDEVMGSLDYIEGDPMLEFGRKLSDSMFFQYISLLMEQLSIKIVRRVSH